MFVITSLILVLGLAAPIAPLAETWNAELNYEEAYGWALDLPGPGCDCLSYPIAGDPPGEDEPRVYDGYIVSAYDENAGTITLSHEEEGDLVFDFPWLSEWLDIQEEWEILIFQAPQEDKPEQQNCAGGSCECDGKCSACCPKGYLPDCNCVGSGKCKCVLAAKKNDAVPFSS